MRIALITFHDAGGSGARVLAALAKQMGHKITLLILHQFRIIEATEPCRNPTAMQSICSGKFRVKKSDLIPISTKEIEICVDTIAKKHIDLIGISSRSVDLQDAVNLIRQLQKKMPETPIIAGGHGPTYDPEAYLQNGATWVVRGEGENTFKELVQAIDTKNDVKSIDNIAYMHKETLRQNPVRKFLEDFSDIPVPLIDNGCVQLIEDDMLSDSDPQFGKRRYATSLGRGCIGKCTYCGSESWNRLPNSSGAPRYRYREFSSIFDELEQAKAHGARFIVFNDEYLVLPTHLLINFFQHYSERINLPFSVNVHPDQLLHSDEVCDVMVKAGLDAFTIGFQTWCEHFARNYFKRYHRFDKLLHLSHKLYDNNVAIASHFISGAKFNTEHEWRSKLNLVAQLPYDPMCQRHSCILDFQYMPTTGSVLYKDVNAVRIPVNIWAQKSMYVQLRHIMDEKIVYDIIHQEHTLRSVQKIYAKRVKELSENYEKVVLESITKKPFFVVYAGEEAREKSYLISTTLSSCSPMPISHFEKVYAQDLHTCVLMVSKNTLTAQRRVKPFFKGEIFCILA